MAGRPLATAYVRIRPLFDTFRRETEDELDKTRAPAEKKGRETGKSFGKGLGDGVKSSATPGLTDLQTRLGKLTSRVSTARVQISGDREAELKLARIDASLAALGHKVVSPKFDSTDLKRSDVVLRQAEIGLDKLTVSAEDAGRGAVGLGGDIGRLSNLAFPALIGAAVATAPVLVTAGLGMGGFGAAAVGAIKPISDAASKTGGLRANMATLTPVQQQLARGILNLGTQYKAFSKSLEPEVVTAFNTALRIGGNVLRDVQPLAKATGTAFNGFLGQIGTTLQNPQWTQFWGFMARTAPGDFQLLTRLVVTLTNTLPPLLENLQPVAETLLNDTTAVLKFVQAGNQLIQFEHAHAVAATKSGGALGFLTHAAEQAANQFLPVGKALRDVQGAMGDVATSSDKAATATDHVNTKLTIQQQAASEAAFQVNALDTAWSSLLALFSSQQAITNADTAVRTFAGDVKKSGANSAIAKTDFLNAATAVAQMGKGLQDAHAPASQIYADLQRQIKALEGAGPLTRQQSRDLAELQSAADRTANSTLGWNTATKNAAKTIENSMLPDLNRMHVNTPLVRRDIVNYTDAIVNSGNKSRATRGDRANLINDLEKAGVNAQTAHRLVDGLRDTIGKLHGKTVDVGVHGSGSGGVHFKQSISPGSGNLFFNTAAKGFFVTQGRRGVDDQLILAQRGELVVPPKLVSAGAVDHLRGQIPGFASGGLVGAERGINQLVPRAAAQETSFATRAERQFITTALHNAAQALAAAASTFRGGAISGGARRWSGTVLKALAMEGLPASLLNQVLHQITTESGGNQFAINLTDVNARNGDPSRGLLQTIMTTFLAYHWPGTSFDIFNPLANIAAAINYARHRYGPTLMRGGNGLGSGHGYAAGTMNARRGWAWVGERGRELVNFAGGEQVLPGAGAPFGAPPAAAAGSSVGAHPGADVKALTAAVQRMERNLTAAIAANADATGTAMARALNRTARVAAKR